MPVISKITGAPFRFWCQKILPAVYDDSLSYYELLCKVVDYLNKVMEDDINVVNLVNELEEYINNYFDNLDVQEEINNKLDAMAEDGTLIDIIAPHLDPIIEEYESQLDEDLSEYKGTIDDEITAFEGRLDVQDEEIETFKDTVNTALSESDNNISVLQSEMDNFIHSHSGELTYTELYSTTESLGAHTVNETFTLSDDYTKYTELDIYWSYNSVQRCTRVKTSDLQATGVEISFYADEAVTVTNVAPMFFPFMKIVNGNAEHTQLQIASAYSERWSGAAADPASRSVPTSASDYSAGSIIKVVGISYQLDSEVLDIRVAYDGTVYNTAGNAVRAQVSDINTYEDLTDIGYLGTLSDTTSTLSSENIVGQKYLFKKGYVSHITINNSNPTTEGTTLFITDVNRTILYKTSKMITSADQVIPIDRYIGQDFYVFLSSKNITYLNNDDVKSNKWLGVSFPTYGVLNVGETLPDFNNNGWIGFGIQVSYLPINKKATVAYDSNKTDIEFIKYDNRMLFNINNDVVSYAKSSRSPLSGCYPGFLNRTDKLSFKVLSNPVWAIISTNASGEFIGIAFQGDGMIVASFMSTGQVKNVDYTATYQCESWLNDIIDLVWENDYFLSIYKNGKLIWKVDYRHTDDTINVHRFGLGVYSNQTSGVLVKLLDRDIPKPAFYEVNVLGDSFSDNTRDALGEGTFYFTRWYEFAKTICRIDTVNNYGFGGTAMSPYASGENSFYNRMMSMKEHVDAVFVQGGTNDYHYDVPLGTITDTTTNTFYGTLNNMCEYLVNHYYDGAVIFCTPIMRVSPAQNKIETYPANEQTNNLGYTLEDYVNAMIEVCAKWAIPCIDMYHTSEICPQTRTSMNYARFMNDGLHLNQYGHKQMGIIFGNRACLYL